MKNKTVTADQIEKVIGERTPIEAEWEGHKVYIKPTLSLQEVLTMVNGVSNSCFRESDGSYLPEIKDFAIKKCIVEMYANFKLSDDVEKDYDIIYNSNIVDFVMANINSQQFREIMKAIDAKIEYVKQSNVASINQQMNKLLESFDGLQEKMSDMFSEVNANDISTLVSAISNGSFDTEALTQAIIKAAEERSRGTATL